MKIVLITLCLITVVIFAACKKSDNVSEPGPGSNFKFNSLVATDTVIKVNDLTTIMASAVGDGLTYNWTSAYGTFVGSGASVQWTVCHQDKFTINCEVTDQYKHSETKTVIVRTEN
jgi:hypothetical protein